MRRPGTWRMQLDKQGLWPLIVGTHLGRFRGYVITLATSASRPLVWRRRGGYQAGRVLVREWGVGGFLSPSIGRRFLGPGLERSCHVPEAEWINEAMIPEESLPNVEDIWEMLPFPRLRFGPVATS